MGARVAGIQCGPEATHALTLYILLLVLVSVVGLSLIRLTPFPLPVLPFTAWRNVKQRVLVKALLMLAVSQVLVKVLVLLAGFLLTSSLSAFTLCLNSSLSPFPLSTRTPHPPSLAASMAEREEAGVCEGAGAAGGVLFSQRALHHRGADGRLGRARRRLPRRLP
ncbi:unnamed protein product [Closterium sp. NIES-64]|nr:unnamed protein product [Closterium sp. NIES-64]